MLSATSADSSWMRSQAPFGPQASATHPSHLSRGVSPVDAHRSPWSVQFGGNAAFASRHRSATPCMLG